MVRREQKKEESSYLAKVTQAKKNYLDHGLETAYDLADSGVEGRQGKMKMHNTIIKRKV